MMSSIMINKVIVSIFMLFLVIAIPSQTHAVNNGQQTGSSKKRVVVELKLDKCLEDKIDVPINESFLKEERTVTEGLGIGGGRSKTYAIAEDGRGNGEGFTIGSDCSYSFYALDIGEEKVQVMFDASIAAKNFKKVFVVTRTKRTLISLRGGVSMIAYLDSENSVKEK